MHEIIEKLRTFHIKQRFALDIPLTACDDTVVNDKLNDLATDLQNAAAELERQCAHNRDPRLHRAQLLVEEVGESIEAMCHRDEVALIDGLSDTLFVAIGTSETFGLPTEAGLNEVCNSNLTKAPRSNADHRLRDKGTSYVPPKLGRVLDDWRVHFDSCMACSHRNAYPLCHAECPHNLGSTYRR